MLESKLVCVFRTSLAAKSITSLVKLRWQLTEVSGCSWGIASVWAAEQVPATEDHHKLAQTSIKSEIKRGDENTESKLFNKKRVKFQLTAVQNRSAQRLRIAAKTYLVSRSWKSTRSNFRFLYAGLAKHMQPISCLVYLLTTQYQHAYCKIQHSTSYMQFQCPVFIHINFSQAAIPAFLHTFGVFLQNFWMFITEMIQAFFEKRL